MKVKCINFYNEVMKQYQDTSSWLTLGKEYIVLEIEIYPGKDMLYRLVGDNTDHSPSLYDSRQFEITSERLPSNWIAYQTIKEMLCFGPKAWRDTGFWEDCYEQDPKALEIYKREARIIYEEEGVL